MNEITLQATKIEAQKALAGMFVCFNLGGSELERKARHDAYLAALGGLPSQSVIAACRDAVQGRIGDGCFVPTAAMIYQRAVSYLPRPEPPTHAANDRAIGVHEKARVNAGFAALCAALKGDDLTDDPMIPAACRPALKEIAANAAYLAPLPRISREWIPLGDAATK